MSDGGDGLRAVAMRVAWASVSVDGVRVAEIGTGQLALIGFGREDGAADLEFVRRRLRSLRIFADAQGRLTHSADALGLGHLLVPQFTLYGDVASGNRPDFAGAMAPGSARGFWETFVRAFGPAESGRFGADMRVALENDGPVTILIDSRRRDNP